MPGYQTAADRKAPSANKAAPFLNSYVGMEGTDTMGH